METSLEKLLKNANTLYANMQSLLIAFEQVNNGASNEINVTLTNPDGTKTNHIVRNNLTLQNEITRIINNYENITNPSNPTYLLNGDGSLAKFIKTDFSNGGFISETELSTNCVISYDSILDNLTFPNVKIPVKINSNIIESKIQSKIYTITDGFDLIPEDVKISDLEFLLQSSTIYGDFKVVNLEIQKQQINTFGEFSILDVEVTNNDNVFICKLNTTLYKQITVDAELKKLDIINDTLSKYQITDIDNINNVVELTRIEGLTIPTVGINNVKFNAIVDSSEKFVNIPVQPNRDIIIFLSTTNELSISYPSNGIKINTNNLTVTTNTDGEISLVQYFEKYVTNITQYFESLVNDSSIPLSLGIKPKTIKLDQRNFNVIQINNHLTSKLTKSQLEDLNTKKTKIKNDIEFYNGKITQLEAELSTKNLKTTEEIEFRNKEINNNRSKIITSEQNLLITTRKIDENAVNFGLKDTKPKYKIVGFSELLGDVVSTATRPQKIIKYEFYYRYLSKNNDEINATSYKFFDGGNENTSTNITVSPWNIAETKTLEKVFDDITNEFIWIENVNDSSEEININQVLISINEGESVEIKVRAISEAGYPISTLKADWSNILRVDFPVDLTENSTSLLINRNVEDLKIAEFREIIRQSGLYRHLSGEVTDGAVRYAHNALDIASGFYTEDERKIIPLFDLLTTIKNDIQSLQTINETEKLFVEFIDYNNDKYVVENNTTLEINAGAYSDTLNLLDSTNYGTVIKKTNYIKIVNNNDIPVEIKSLIPGVSGNLISTDNEFYYNVPIFGQNNFNQKRKQIIYFRNSDITKQLNSEFQLYVDPLTPKSNFISNQLIDTTALEADKNLIFVDNTNIIRKCKLLSNDNLNFNVYTTEHSLFDESNTNNVELLNDFERLSYLNETVKSKKQEKINSNLFIGFRTNDKFAVGNNTVGSFLYPIFTNESKLQVVGNNTTSSVIIPKNSEIIIPIIFEYRMTDRLGVINGDINLSVTDNFTYNKKIGIDLLLNNETLSFDLEFKADFKSEIPSIDSLNISGITANTN